MTIFSGAIRSLYSERLKNKFLQVPDEIFYE